MAWSGNENKHLIKAFRSGKSLTQIAKDHQRPDGAIRSRLIKLGLIKE